MLERYIDDTLKLLPIPLGDVSQDGTITEADRAFLELFGYGSSELIGRPAIELCAEPEGDTMPHRVPFLQIHDQTLHIGPVRERECLIWNRGWESAPTTGRIADGNPPPPRGSVRM